jgi:hypothetical protein
MMKILNHKKYAFILKLNPFELGIIAFLRTFAHPSDFVASRPFFGDEFETVCEGFYETEDTSIFV